LPRRAEVTANGARSGNAPEIRRVLRPVGLRKIRVIENIESLSTELQVDAFLDRCVLCDRQIYVLKARTFGDIPAGVSETARMPDERVSC
jgi:hypothetical protein